MTFLIFPHFPQPATLTCFGQADNYRTFVYIQPDICDSLLHGPSSYALSGSITGRSATIHASLHTVGTGSPPSGVKYTV